MLLSCLNNILSCARRRTFLLRSFSSTSTIRPVYPSPPPTPSPPPLTDLRVLDLTRILAGPYCTQALGDFGADVIKIEHVKGGDDTRSWGPPFTPTNVSAYFISANRNKRSVAVDIKTARGRDIVQRLAETSDVVIENFLPGKVKALGLDYATLSARNSRLIYASISGFGQDGPYAHRSGYDVIVSAVGGLMNITGTTAEPVKVGVAVTDICTGLFTLSAILAALHHRTRTGRGQCIDASLMDTQVALLANIGQNWLVNGSDGQRRGTAHESIVPYQLFNTADGGIVCGALNDKQFTQLCAVLSLDELSRDQRYNSNQQRVANRNTLIGALQARFITLTTAEASALLDRVNLPNGPVNTLTQVFNDDHVRHRASVQTLHNHSTEERMDVLSPPVKLSDSAATIRLPPPLHGQHTIQVLQERLGMELNEINALIEQGVLAAHKQPTSSAT